MIRFIDVSAIQGNINWAKVAGAGLGIRGVYLRCTVGMGTADARYRTNLAGVRAAGFAPGAYHFAKPSLSPGMATYRDDAIGECHRFAELADLCGAATGEMRPVLDAETMDGLNAQQVANWLDWWVEEAALLFGRWPMIYGGKGLEAAFKLMRHALKCEFWIAAYPQSQNKATKVWSPALTFEEAETRWQNGMGPPRIAPWGTDLRAWQHSGGGPQPDGSMLVGNVIPGILDGNSMPWTDCNVFAGGESEWRTHCNLDVVHPNETGPAGEGTPPEAA